MHQAIWFVTLICVWHPLSGSPGGAVATVDPIATDAAIAAMKKGGNAVDGAVAAGLMLGVVNGYNSGIGGGCFMVIRLANGKFVVIDGRERFRGQVNVLLLRRLIDATLPHTLLQ